MERLLGRNTSTRQALSFLGSGCYQHHVPAVVDEVVNRSEFLTAYAGEPYEDHGRFQALWEYQSMMAELLDVEIVNVPVYDGFQAAGTALRMVSRITGRRRVLVATAIDGDKLSRIRDYVRPDHDVTVVPVDPGTGCADLDAVRDALAAGDTAAVYADTPSALGIVDEALPASPNSRIRRGRCTSWAAIRSPSGCSRRPPRSAPTSRAATSSRSASTRASAAATRASSPPVTRSGWSPSTPHACSAWSRRPSRASTASATSPTNGPRSHCARRARSGSARPPRCTASAPGSTSR